MPSSMSSPEKKPARPTVRLPTSTGPNEKKPVDQGQVESQATIKHTPGLTANEEPVKDDGQVHQGGGQTTGENQGPKGWKKTRRGKRGSKGKNVMKTPLGAYMAGPGFESEDEKPPTEGQGPVKDD